MTPWQQHVEKWKDCRLCALCDQRDRIILARGQVPAEVVFIGEAPGASEDALGQPFIGPAGHLLDQIIDRSVPNGTSYALSNLVACFPREAKSRGENEPSHREIIACRPRLKEFIQICQPRLIVSVGKLAAEYVEQVEGVKLTDIVHPAAILRMPLAQKNMAVQRSIVVIRNAVEIVQSVIP